MHNDVRACFDESERLLDRALRTIPLGTQTFSKSHTQFPRGAAPFFMRRAHGSKAWDVDGNCYTDFANALASITLGHCDPDVSDAVQRQVQDGTIFALAHPLEIEVAELIVEMVPCAEMVRFGKNGSDATSGAVRAARAHTGRDRVAACGYHGWQDWYIGSTARNKGVPRATSDLTHVFTYNNLESLHAVLRSRPGEFAAVILEPMNIDFPRHGFLQGVRELARQHGALTIFDETITGFRFSNGGAQELFDQVPDLATFGKGLANGYPIAAVAGRADVMAEFEEIFFSFTMGGETLSLAAAKATLEKVRRENVTARLSELGGQVVAGVRESIVRHGCEQIFDIKGHPSWSFLVFKDVPDVSVWHTKTLWIQEILRRGLLSTGTHNMSFAHTPDDVAHLLAVYEAVFPLVREAVERKSVLEYLHCKPLEALFRVR